MKAKSDELGAWSEAAWIVDQRLNGRLQYEIAAEIDYSDTLIAFEFSEFCTGWSGLNVAWEMIPVPARLGVAQMAMHKFLSAGGSPKKPAIRTWVKGNIYWEARAEHVLRLRSESLSMRGIGERLGMSKTRVWQIIKRHERNLPIRIRLR
jgi:hypothetical protein